MHRMGRRKIFQIRGDSSKPAKLEIAVLLFLNQAISTP
jgi:hypothetical protein